MSTPEPSARRHRGLYWTAVLVAVLAVLGGGAVAVIGYTSSAGPSGVVTGYFAALARGDAPAALAYGDAPHGEHTYLTSTVLAAQQRRAPISHVQVVGVDRHGDDAQVSVRYRLGLAAGARTVADTVAAHKAGRTWRLATTAADVRLRLSSAAGRATMVGGRVPTATVPLFPGAVPISFDSPYLHLAAAHSYVRLSDFGTKRLAVVVSDAGHRAITRAVHDALAGCVRASVGPATTCPLPKGRYVPGSLHGKVAALAGGSVDLTLSGDAGLVRVTGTARFTGSYRQLDYDNIAAAKTGSLDIPFAAQVYALAPLRVTWAGEAA